MREGRRANRGDDDAPDAGDGGTTTRPPSPTRAALPGNRDQCRRRRHGCRRSRRRRRPERNGSADADAAAAAAQARRAGCSQIPPVASQTAAAGRTAPATPGVSVRSGRYGLNRGRPAPAGPTGVELPDRRRSSPPSPTRSWVRGGRPRRRRPGAGPMRRTAAAGQRPRPEFTLATSTTASTSPPSRRSSSAGDDHARVCTPEYVEGVVDLRGQITTILDPGCCSTSTREGARVAAGRLRPDEFEDQGAIGWVVDEVRQVRSHREIGGQRRAGRRRLHRASSTATTRRSSSSGRTPVAIELATGEQGDD